MNRTAIKLLCVALMSGAGVDTFARGPGGGGAGHAGSATNSHALANSNGRSAPDRDTGLDRAAERMSAQGLAHEKAGSVQERQRRQPAPSSSPATRSRKGN